MQTKHNWQNFVNDEAANWFIKDKRNQGFKTCVSKMSVSSQWRYRVYWW